MSVVPRVVGIGVFCSTLLAARLLSLLAWPLAVLVAAVDCLLAVELVCRLMRQSNPSILAPSVQVQLVFGLLRSLVIRRLLLRTTFVDARVARLPKFVSARQAAALVPSGSIVYLTGIGSNAQPCNLFSAIRERFDRQRQPSNLTLVAASGVGGRGRGPGTAEMLAAPGLLGCMVTGHAETYKAMLGMADAGQLELHILPQGLITLMLRAAAHGGEPSVRAVTGVGTFLDPRCGRGTLLARPDSRGVASESLVELDANGVELAYHMPHPNVTLLNAPLADRDGNIYVDGATMLAELYDAAAAVKRSPSGGLVLVQVGRLLEPGEPHGPVYVPSSLVDAIVLEPRTEQVLGAMHTSPFRFLTLAFDRRVPIHESVARVSFLNATAKLTPVRSELDMAMARLGIWYLVPRLCLGATMDVGTGLPELLTIALVQYGGAMFERDLTLYTESGVIGGTFCVMF